MDPNNRSLISDHRSRDRRSRAASRRAVALRGGGFTLVELMIAAAITVVIVLVLGGMFLSLMNTSLRASQRIDAFRDARAALQIIERDIANLVQLPEMAPYFASTDLYSDPSTATQKNQQLYALCALKNQPTGNPAPVAGDMCAVGYYCRWEGNRYTLRRYFRNSAELMADNVYFTNLGRSTPPWNIRANGPGVYMPPSKLYQPSDTDAPTANPPTFKDDVLAAYVWNFKVTLYDATGVVISTYPYICDPLPPTTNPLPAAVEISFNAMSPQAARTVMSVTSSPNDWMDPTTQNYQRLILPHMYQFRTRINLQ